MERPLQQEGDYQTLRSTREIRGSAEEVYRDLLVGDLRGIPVRGRQRWEKRLSHEEIVLSIPGVVNEEEIPFLSTVLKKKKSKKEEIAEGGSVILKEWRKMRRWSGPACNCRESIIVLIRFGTPRNPNSSSLSQEL